MICTIVDLFRSVPTVHVENSGLLQKKRVTRGPESLEAAVTPSA
jgi:hypothetical protein